MAFPKRVATALLLTYSLLTVTASPHVARDPTSFVTSERTKAVQGILANIGAHGTLSQGAKSGVVIASPSTINPNYLYTWTRDSALTLHTLVDEFINGDTTLQFTIEDYITAEAIRQTVSNPSGSLTTGEGLGEPKFNIDLTRFNGVWGRPQRDGPALRAITLMTYINWLVSNKRTDRAKNVVWPVVVNDLNYVGQYWNQTGFDLWEEVSGSSFFTIQNQHRALAQGSQVAKTLGLNCASCDSQAPEILCFLQTFWNGKYITSNINAADGRSGKDSNSILGSIADFDIDADCDSPTFQPCNSRSLANFKVLIDSFRPIFTINNGTAAGSAVAIGRYPEDTYYGGNPWYICTLAAAEFLYDAVAQWKARQSLTVDSTSLAFFQEIYPAVTAGQYPLGNSKSPFTQITNAATAYADGFVNIVEKYLPTNSSISEQYSRDTGMPLSAYDLTWSFAAFVTMAQRRSGQYPVSWGSRQAVAPPATCQGTSAPGVYAPATAAGAPSTNTTCTVNVLFSVNASTYYGENVFIIGNSTALGDWVPSNADPLNPSNYTTADPVWYAYIDVPASTAISYKYLRQESNASYIYETGNRTFLVPACGVASATETDTWVGPTGTPS